MLSYYQLKRQESVPWCMYTHVQTQKEIHENKGNKTEGRDLGN